MAVQVKKRRWWSGERHDFVDIKKCDRYPPEVIYFDNVYKYGSNRNYFVFAQLGK